MHKSAGEANRFVAGLRAALTSAPACEVRVYPTFTALNAAAQAAANSPIGVGAQNLHWEKQGAFTGEISASMLLDAGATSVLVGHSERRQLFGESDAAVAKKVNAALTAGLAVVLCIGETLPEREAGLAQAVVERQLRAALQDVADTAAIDIAYEPVWAIGTGKTASAQQAQEMHAFIRGILPSGRRAAARILYGGSVKPDNAASLLAQPDVDGLLVGGASLELDSFCNIIAAGSRQIN